jgi:predicted ATPase
MAHIDTVEIRGYRCFRHLEVQGLSSVNLFVGRNNSGKTALLEAIEAVVSAASPRALYRAAWERGEFRVHAHGEPGDVAIDVRRWFSGHTLEPGASVYLRAASASGILELTREIEGASVESAAPFRLVSRSPVPLSLAIAPDGFLGAGSPEGFVEAGLRLRPPVGFVTTRRRTAAELAPMWSNLVLTPSEADVLAALRTLDPSISRIALTGSNGDATARVLLDGSLEPVPLGSLGEGATRLLTLALAFASVRGGYLFIDEVENGLHFSVHRSVWKLIIETARRLDVQVFATTHSKDCLEGLARLHEEHAELTASVTAFRLEQGRSEPVRMSVETVAATLEGQVEVR